MRPPDLAREPQAPACTGPADRKPDGRHQVGHAGFSPTTAPRPGTAYIQPRSPRCGSAMVQPVYVQISSLIHGTSISVFPNAPRLHGGSMAGISARPVGWASLPVRAGAETCPTRRWQPRGPALAHAWVSPKHCSRLPLAGQLLGGVWDAVFSRGARRCSIPAPAIARVARAGGEAVRRARPRAGERLCSADIVQAGRWSSCRGWR